MIETASAPQASPVGCRLQRLPCEPVSKALLSEALFPGRCTDCAAWNARQGGFGGE
jgi:hypothetical protein